MCTSLNYGELIEKLQCYISNSQCQFKNILSLFVIFCLFFLFLPFAKTFQPADYSPGLSSILIIKIFDMLLFLL